MKHDSGYHLLFSNPILVQELIEGFVDQPWVQDIDFSTLERVNAKMHSSSLERREGDVIYKIQSFSGKPVYVYLFLEFQSKPDHWMALRFATYVMLFWQQLIKEKQLLHADKVIKTLPPVFPLVLYNGEYRWGSPIQLSELIDLPNNSSLQAYQPQMQYYLLDEGRHEFRPSVLNKRPLIDILFRMENCSNVKSMHMLVQELLKVVSAPEYKFVKRDVANWISEVQLVGLAKKFKPDKNRKHNDEFYRDLDRLTEDRIMLVERLRQWEAEFVEQGIEKGIAQGEESILHEMALHLMTVKFGEISEEIRHQFEAASSDNLKVYIERMLMADNIDQVIKGD